METIPQVLSWINYALFSGSCSVLFLCQVLAEAERAPLQQTSQNMTYDLLCALANPSRADTRGLTYLAEVAERFAFSLLTNSQCEM